MMKISFPLRPRLIDALKNYTVQNFWTDAGAGVTVGIIALSAKS
jgi:hypothetical protein